MSTQAAYFRASGDAVEIIETFMAERQASRAAARAFAQEHGFDDLIRRGPSWIAFHSKEKVPAERWPPGTRGGREAGLGFVVRPYHRTSEGRALAKRFRALPRSVDGRTLADRLFGRDFGFEPALLFPSAGCEKLGETWVVSMREELGEAVEESGCRSDLERLKMSEYWLLKESQEEAA